LRFGHHIQAGNCTAHTIDFDEPGGTVTRSFRICPSATACACSAIASMCQLEMKSFAGSTVAQDIRMNFRKSDVASSAMSRARFRRSVSSRASRRFRRASIRMSEGMSDGI